MNKLQLSAKKPGRMPKTEKMRLCPFVQEMEKDSPLYGGKKNRMHRNILYSDIFYSLSLG